MRDGIFSALVTILFVTSLLAAAHTALTVWQTRATRLAISAELAADKNWRERYNTDVPVEVAFEGARR